MQDVVDMAGLERFSALVELTPASTDVSFVVLQIDDNTQGNRYSIAVHSTDHYLGWHVYANGVAIMTLDPPPPFVAIDGVVNKVCVIVDKPEERVGVSLNGSDVIWSRLPITTWPQDLTTLRIGSSLGGWFFREPLAATSSLLALPMRIPRRRGPISASRISAGQKALAM
ncbi:MAG TPA: hypothetical protein VK634_16485 [Reyranella sp.]|nr:hypothetical protein [Reyranella sp.]